MKEIDHFYLQKEEPVRSCLQALRTIILQYHTEIKEAWKYKTAFFCYRGKNICYLWIDKKTKHPYIGIIDGYKIEHTALETGNRIQFKIMRIDPCQDLPVDTIYEILREIMLCNRP
jgi:Domain of unknown function (DU1801)